MAYGDGRGNIKELGEVRFIDAEGGSYFINVTTYNMALQDRKGYFKRDVNQDYILEKGEPRLGYVLEKLNGREYQINIHYANQWQEGLMIRLEEYNGNPVNEPTLDIVEEYMERVNEAEKEKHEEDNDWSIIVNPRRIALAKYLNYTPQETIKFIEDEGDHNNYFDLPQGYAFDVYTDAEADEAATEQAKERARDMNMSDMNFDEIKQYAQESYFAKRKIKFVKDYLAEETSEFELESTAKYLLKTYDKNDLMDYFGVDANLDNDTNIIKQVYEKLSLLPKKMVNVEVEKTDDWIEWYIEKYGESEFSDFVSENDRNNNVFNWDQFVDDYADNELQFNSRREYLSGYSEEYEVEVDDVTYFLYPR